jgi:hypothetical protein
VSSGAGIGGIRSLSDTSSWGEQNKRFEEKWHEDRRLSLLFGVGLFSIGARGRFLDSFAVQGNRRADVPGRGSNYFQADTSRLHRDMTTITGEVE